VQHDTANRWDTYYASGQDFALETAQGTSRFLSFSDPASPRTALDIGCGTGQLSRELWHRGYTVVGIELSEQAINQARALTVVPANALAYVQFNIEQDSLSLLAHQPYGLITCKFVYAFVQSKAAFLERVQRLLAPQGTFVVITPLPESVPPEKQGITVAQDDIDLLGQYFKQLAWYKYRGSGYFIGSSA